MNQITDTVGFALLAGESGFDPIEERLRVNVRATIEAIFEEELTTFLGRLRYDRGDGPAKGYRHGHYDRQLTGTFGTETVRVPRARIEGDAGNFHSIRDTTRDYEASTPSGCGGRVPPAKKPSPIGNR